MEPIQLLLNARRADLFATDESAVPYVAFYTEAYSVKLKELSELENLVRMRIEQYGTRGVWARDLRKTFNLSQVAFNKAIKALEQRNLVKSFKPVINKVKKMFITDDLEPAAELTGGPWFNNGEFDRDFAHLLESLFEIEMYERACTVEELTDKFHGVSNHGPLTPDITLATIDALLYDGRIRKLPRRPNDAQRFRTCQQPKDDSWMPCDTCPHFKQCSADNPKINPATCQPFRDWFGGALHAPPPSLELPRELPREVQQKWDQLQTQMQLQQ